MTRTSAVSPIAALASCSPKEKQQPLAKGVIRYATDGSVHSTIKDPTGRLKGYVLHASDDGKSWHKVKEGELESSPNALRIKLDAVCTARYLKLEATSLHAGTDMMLTELEVYTR